MEQIQTILSNSIFQILIPIILFFILIAVILALVKFLLNDIVLKMKNKKKQKMRIANKNFEIKTNENYNSKDEYYENKQWEFKSFRGDISEKNTVMQISEMSKLPIIQNPIITGYNGFTSEIDMIMINECGVFVIENKSYSGRLIGKQNELKWTQLLNLKKIKFYNPIMQNEKHIKVLKGKLKLNNPIPYFNIVVFGGKIDISDIESDDTVLLTTRNSIRVELYKLINKSDKIINDIEQRSIHRKIMAISKFDEESREKHIEQIIKGIYKH